MTATLRAELNRDIEDYLILGTRNPHLAAQALDGDRSVGLLLPCNVAIRTAGQWTAVQALDPATMVTLTGLAAMTPVADEKAAARAVLTACTARRVSRPESSP
ncbi:hypothetical protein GCM10010207_61610 [Streptomyces atratus]|nr:hypothetical protein GCM10010207_61610 [Streptomyces atratus]